MIEVTVPNSIQTEPLIKRILETFPALKKGKIKIISKTAENSYALQVDALVPRAKLEEIVRAQAKDDGMVASTPLDQVTKANGEAYGTSQELEASDLGNILKIAMKIPGAKNVIESALAILSLVDDTISKAGDGILRNVGALETKVFGIEQTILTLQSDLNNLTDDKDGKIPKLEKQMVELSSQVSLLLSLFTNVGQKTKAEEEKAKAKPEKKEKKSEETQEKTKVD